MKKSHLIIGGALVLAAAGVLVYSKGNKGENNFEKVEILDWNGTEGTWLWNGTRNYFSARSNGTFGGDNEDYNLFVGPKADGNIYFDLLTRDGQFVKTLLIK